VFKEDSLKKEKIQLDPVNKKFEVESFSEDSICVSKGR
jgi:hypothetical protein